MRKLEMSSAKRWELESLGAVLPIPRARDLRIAASDVDVLALVKKRDKQSCAKAA